MITTKTGVRNKLTPLKEKNNKENGFAIDLLSTCLVIIVAFFLVLVMLTFSKVVETKIDADIIGKNYLYRMEQQGYFKGTDKDDMIKSFKAKGITTSNESVELKINTDTTVKQVAYGTPVTLDFTVTFANPMYDYLPERVGAVGIKAKGLLAKDFSYTLKYTTTSKWQFRSKI